MERHGINLNAYCYVKKASLESLCTRWFQWHAILEKAKLEGNLYVCSCAQLCPTLCNPLDCTPPGISQAEMGDCHFLLHGVFPTQALNLSLLCHRHCRWTFEALTCFPHQGSPWRQSKDPWSPGFSKEGGMNYQSTDDF